MSDNPIHAESVHLFNLAHTVPLTPINAYFNNKFIGHSFDNSIPQSPIALGRYCLKCSSILIPGLSVSIKILYRKSKKSKSKGGDKKEPKARRSKDDVLGRRLQFKCLTCKHKHIEQEALIQLNQKRIQADTDVEEQKLPPNTKSKERSRKRKGSTLSTMLEKKKKLKDGKSGIGSLNLMEFMS